MERTPLSRSRVIPIGSPPESSSPRKSSRPFVGRERELGELTAALEETLGESGRLFLISGEPGIGKTRLAERTSDIAAERGARVLWGRCSEERGAPAYWPWVQIVRKLIAGNSGKARAPDTRLGDLFKLMPQLSAAQDGWADSVALPGDPEQARFRLFDSAAVFLADASRERPILVAIDDLHAADDPSLLLLLLLLLRFVTRQIHDTPILVIGTYREGEVPRQSILNQLIGDMAGDVERSRCMG
jgi:predicted ATPase